MKQFYLLRASCLAASFLLSIFSATASLDTQLIRISTATAILLFGLIFELFIRYKTEDKQHIYAVCLELLITGATFFVGYVLISWIFNKFAPFNTPLGSSYNAARTLNFTILYVYFYYLWGIYLKSRKNKAQKEPIAIEKTDTDYKNK